MQGEADRPEERTWRDGEALGVQFALLKLHEDSGGATVLTRFAAGARGGRHAHPGGEELFVLEGRCLVDEVALSAGDYLYTPPGASHELIAETDTLVIVFLPKLPIYEPRAQ